jgi:hypothetical protein
MMKRSVITLSSLIVTYALLGSVVFTGVSLSSKLLGRWRVVKVFEADISRVFPPMTIDLDRGLSQKGWPLFIALGSEMIEGPCSIGSEVG